MLILLITLLVMLREEFILGIGFSRHVITFVMLIPFFLKIIESLVGRTLGKLHAKKNLISFKGTMYDICFLDQKIVM